jgi:hypothetical protein
MGSVPHRAPLVSLPDHYRPVSILVPGGSLSGDLTVKGIPGPARTGTRSTSVVRASGAMSTAGITHHTLQSDRNDIIASARMLQPMR